MKKIILTAVLLGFTSGVNAALTARRIVPLCGKILRMRGTYRSFADESSSKARVAYVVDQIITTALRVVNRKTPNDMITTSQLMRDIVALENNVTFFYECTARGPGISVANEDEYIARQAMIFADIIQYRILQLEHRKALARIGVLEFLHNPNPPL